MPGTFKWLKQEFLIEGAWDGIDLDGPVRHLKAGIGAGCSSLADAFWITLGAVSLKLLPAVTEQVQASRATVEFDNGIWIITHDLITREVVFLNTTSGEVQEFAVFPEGGERSAGSYTVELMGIPVVETARGSVTLDSVMSLLYLQQIHASRIVYGGANGNDLAVTFEVVFCLLDEKAAKLKAQSTAAKRKATKASSALEKAIEQRMADGLPVAIDLDTEEARLAKAADTANAEVLRLQAELDAHLSTLATRAQEAARALQAARDAGVAADRTQQALAPLYEARGQARAALAHAQEAAKARTHCPECAQPLRQRTGPGPACVLCRQPDTGQADRLALKARNTAAAQAALTGVEDRLKAAQATAQKAVEARRTAEQAAQKATSRTDAYRSLEITPREQAKAQAQSTAAGHRAAIAAVRERRKELIRITDLDRLAKQTADEADKARQMWAMAEGDAQHVRERTAKELSMIFAEKVIPMAPDKIRHASIDPRTFAPKLNGRTVRQLARSAGLVNIANSAVHLTFLEAARTLDGVLLPAAQWLDASLDGLGAGHEGAQLADRTLKVLAATAAGDAQILIATAHDLPVIPGNVTTDHDSHHPVIPHARAATDDAL